MLELSLMETEQYSFQKRAKKVFLSPVLPAVLASSLSFGGIFLGFLYKTAQNRPSSTPTPLVADRNYSQLINHPEVIFTLKCAEPHRLSPFDSIMLGPHVDASMSFTNMPTDREVAISVLFTDPNQNPIQQVLGYYSRSSSTINVNQHEYWGSITRQLTQKILAGTLYQARISEVASEEALQQGKFGATLIQASAALTSCPK